MDRAQDSDVAQFFGDWSQIEKTEIKAPVIKFKNEILAQDCQQLIIKI